MDYAMPGKRKSKTDKRAKARYSKYKRGGSQRVRKKKDRGHFLEKDADKKD